MRYASVILGSVTLALALVAAPVVTAASPVAAGALCAAQTCCKCCPAPDASGAAECCLPTDEDGSPTSSDPCQSDCGQCPCCPSAAPSGLAILADSRQAIALPLVGSVFVACDLLSSRSDEPLLPPPRA